MYKLGVDIGGTKINIGIFDAETKELIENRKSYIADITDLAMHIKNVVEEICSNNNIDFKSIISCGVGIPGTVSEDGRKIIKAPNIKILSEDIVESIEDILKVPTRLVQDSRAAAWGEYLCGGGRNTKSVVCVTLGTGIGTGIVINNEIYNGALGCAGELGHLVVVENGRKCGCGKQGCLEKYCAGGGLDITAQQILGEGKKATDLFEKAKDGDNRAIEAIENAVQMLGQGLVSIVNLMSPECILFSGGLSEQKELYLNPVIDYIKSHCYIADKLPIIKKAELGENSPLYGAAFIPIEEHKRTPLLAASIMCADILNMEKALCQIKEAGIHYLHCDIMDNHFVPNMMMPMEFLNKLRIATDLPFDFHIMAENPETVIEKLVVKENDIISIHYESTIHLQRVITLVKEKGAKVSVAINPATPISVLDEVLPELDMVLVMSVNPGFAGQKIVKSSFDKIRKLRSLLSEKGLNNILIEVDGNCSFENVPKMYEAGADVFVVGTSSVFKSDMTIKEGTEKLFSLL